MGLCVLNGCSKSTTPLTWETSQIHGRLQPGQLEATFTFRATNTSPSPVHIAEIAADCECLSLDQRPRTLAPGESSEFLVRFLPGSRTGKLKKRIYLQIQGEPETQVLTLQIDVPTLVKMDPAALTWNQGGPAHPQVLRLRFQDPAWSVTQARSTSALFSVETASQGGTTTLTVTPSSTTTPAQSQLLVLTSCPHAPANRIMVPLSVR